MFEFLFNLFRKRGKEFDKFNKIVTSYSDIINRVKEEIDKLYDKSNKYTGNDKTRFTNQVDNLNKQFTKLQKELEKFVEILSRKTDKTTVFNQCLHFYRHKRKKQEVEKYVSLLKVLREQIHIIAVRSDLAILELRDEIRTIQDFETKKNLTKDIEKYLYKIDENTVEIYNLIDRLIQELNLLK